MVNQTQQYRKRVIYCYIKLIPGVQNGFNIQKSIKILNYINKLKRKSHIKYMQKKHLTEIQHSSFVSVYWWPEKVKQGDDMDIFVFEKDLAPGSVENVRKWNKIWRQTDIEEGIVRNFQKKVIIVLNQNSSRWGHMIAISQQLEEDLQINSCGAWNHSWVSSLS